VTLAGFLTRLSHMRLYAEPALDNAVSGMVTVRLVIPLHTAPFLFLHRVPPIIHSPQKIARATHTEMSRNVNVCIQPEHVKTIPRNKWHPR
jgi:hypothetical protein